MAATTYASSDKSKRLFTGIPRAVAFVGTADSVIRSAVASVLLSGNEDLQKKMKQSPYWSDYSDNVNIVWTGSEFAWRLSGSEEVISAMKELEYGVPGRAPHPLLRSAVFNMSSEVSQRLSAAVTGALLGY